MEINEKLYISAEEFFDAIAESVAYDISESTGKKVRPKQIKKGFTYSKKLKTKIGKKGTTKITITQFEAPICYSAEFISSQGTNEMSYHIEPLEDGSIGVHYEENFKGSSKLKELNFKLVSIFYNRSAKKRAKRLLRSIEQFVIEKRKKSEPEENEIEE